MVYYLKYRPQTIAQLDNPALREKLYSVLSSQNIPHAFLFTGPKGLGKTSTARIIAKVLNCTNNALGKEQSAKGKSSLSTKPLASSDIEPCGRCDQCVSITNGTNIDVLEIDGASNRGIDEIRDLRDKVKLAPSSARTKVYIIDEVHMLTTEAFNALLKTIEEPPSHVVFIFATTEPQKVPATIVSRCFHIALSKATDEEIVHALERIKKGEKLDCSDDALATIAKMSDGGFRDATKMLEEIVALSNGKAITKEFVEEKLNVAGSTYYVVGMFEALSKKDVKKGLTIISEMTQKGTDVRYFISQLLSVVHELLLSQVGIPSHTTNYILPTTITFSSEELQLLVELFSQAYLQTKYAVIPSLPLELAVVKWCTPQNQESKTRENVILVSPQRTHPGSRSWVHQDQDSGQARMTTSDLLKKEKNLKVQAVIKGTGPKAHRPMDEKETHHSQENLPNDSNSYTQLMENLIYKVKPYNHSVAGVLRGCRIVSMKDGIIVFETSYKFHKERLDDKKIKEILETVLREITGKAIKVMVELKS